MSSSETIQREDFLEDNYIKRKLYASRKKINICQVVIDSDKNPIEISVIFENFEKSNDSTDLFRLINEIYLSNNQFLTKRQVLFNYFLYKKPLISEYKIKEYQIGDILYEKGFAGQIKKYIYSNLYDILELNIFSYDDENHNNFLNKIVSEYKSWEKNLKVDYSNHIEKINIIHEILKEQDYGNILNSDTKIIGLNVEYKPQRKDGQKIKKEDMIGFFDNMKISEFVPIVKYIDDRNIFYYKTFDAGKINLQKIKIRKRENRKNFLYFKVCIHKNGLTYNIPDQYLILFSYDAENNLLSAKIHIDENSLELKEIEKKLEDCFQLLDFSKKENSEMKAEIDLFRFQNQEFTEVSEIKLLTHVVSSVIRYGSEIEKISDITRRHVFGAYLFASESEKLLIDSKTMRLNLLSLSSNFDFGNNLNKNEKLDNLSKVKFSIVNKKTEIKDVNLIDNSGDLVGFELPIGTDFIRLKIKKCNDEKQIQILLNVLKFLINYYYENLDQFVSTIDSLSQNILSLVNVESIKNLSNAENIKEKKTHLKDINDEIFVPGYYRFCRESPKVIDESEKEDWESNIVVDEDGIKRNLQTMLFPRTKKQEIIAEKRLNGFEVNEEEIPDEDDEQQRYLLTCTHKDYPFIGVRENKTLKNKDQYPFLPCCFKTDQMDPYKSTPYNVYYRGIDNRVKREKVNYIIRGDKKLEKYQIGEMYEEFSKVAFGEIENYKIKRIGITDRKDSFIHCVVCALNQKYITDFRARENMVRDLRSQMKKKINCMKQELYNYENDEIIKILSDEESYIDPALFYRSLEIIFEINIFIATLSENMIEMPNHWKFHCRYENEYHRTIILYKNIGNGIDDIPQYELVFGHPADNLNARVYLFDEKVSQNLFKFLSIQNDTISWVNSFKDSETIGLKNIFKTDFSKIFKIHSQYIDCYGKTRLLNVSLNDETFTIAIHPGRPYDVDLIDINDEKSIRRIELSKILSMLNIKPTSCDVLSNGIWFRLYDYEEGFFVFISDDISEKKYKKSEGIFFRVPSFHRYDQHQNLALKYLSMRKVSNIVIFFTEWLYENYLINRSDPKNITKENRNHLLKRFISKMEADNFSGNQSEYYQTTENLSYFLPRTENFEQSMNYVKSVCPRLISEKGKIVYVDRELYEKMKRYIANYSSKFEGIVPIQRRVISNYYNTVEDFQFQKNVLVFRGNRDYIRWSRNKDQNYVIKTSLNINYSSYTSSYIYHNIERDKYYIVQNVLNGDIFIALNLCVNWFENRFNSGFYYHPLENQELIEIINYKIYGINRVGKLVLTEQRIDEKKIGETESIAEILLYGNNTEEQSYKRYAAMLPLN